MVFVISAARKGFSCVKEILMAPSSVFSTTIHQKQSTQFGRRSLKVPLAGKNLQKILMKQFGKEFLINFQKI